ncbi:hypothetical protein SAMD00019534_117000 [Acytostelium subglobosum LB1]|uniref:hypothetical protein n=1 Tax=Acytostelium subglobosum LB1 TaxID=1410327 RepID=UPI000644DFC9|nr:hypothetical protein SAMD00019534_117000 [Acytostelium subglobosum LB1]GAM28524.1 hypothetical protein SAMD00019534_117000 [Acytostelium subglobosum LB1]|eukprot:XP_012748563.1 hypothetical protein SAMD00019534_117000 [Acytostelium subglobosum LB1]
MLRLAFTASVQVGQLVLNHIPQPLDLTDLSLISYGMANHLDLLKQWIVSDTYVFKPVYKQGPRQPTNQSTYPPLDYVIEKNFDLAMLIISKYPTAWLFSASAMIGSEQEGNVEALSFLLQNNTGNYSTDLLMYSGRGPVHCPASPLYQHSI